MGQFTIKLPDVGEGVAEAELVEWVVKVGQNVQEDEVLAAVMTDKATVEIPSPVEGKINWLGAEIGDIVAVGSPIIRIDVEGEGNSDDVVDTPPKEAVKVEAASAPVEAPSDSAPAKLDSHSSAPAMVTTAPISRAAPSNAAASAPRAEGEKPLASPAVRKRAQNAGIDLRAVAGSGPAGRITHDDIDQVMSGAASPSAGGARRVGVADHSISEIKVIGLRRKIAEKMSTAKSRIPHITYVDEVDMTNLEDLRARLNQSKREDQTKLTVLPFLMRAMVKAIQEQPQMNAIFDDEAGVIHQYGGVHMGVAAQTPNGLMVPVVRHTEARSIWDCASEVSRLAVAAREGTAKREELSGSTITITSLGAMGGLVTTPVINHPEVAIIGVNKMQIKPVWDGTQFIPKKMMNLSSSFDHRVIDGWDCAIFIQRIKSLLESPAEIFIEE